MRSSGAQVVYTELKRRILTLELAPGARIYEPALAAELEVSRTPLREAIRLLTSESLLVQQPTGGVVVPPLDQEEIAELYDVRAALSGLLAREAARRATPADLARLEDLLARNAALVSFAEDAMHAGGDLHDTIAEIAGNRWAIRFHAQVTEQMARYRRLTNASQRRREEALANHREIVAAITAGDDERAAALASRHVLDARDEALRVMNPES